MLPLRILPLLAILILNSPVLPNPSRHRLIQENILLKSEYQLAKSSVFYLFFDLVENRIQLKSRGFLLKDFPIKDSRILGAPIPARAMPIKKRASLFKPKQVKIKPPINVEGNEPILPAVDVKDMPSRYLLARYLLELNGGVSLYIRPIYNNRLLNLLNLFSSLKTYGVTLPVGTLSGVFKNERYTEINLYLTPEDAKALFWVAREGIPCLIFTP